MPRPRFEKLPPERRAHILEVAAREFGALGYEGASLNRILEKAELSKGAAYYYFDDKADLFLAVVQHSMEQLMLVAQLRPEELRADTFWDVARATYRRQFLIFRQHPWLMGVARAVWTLPAQLREGGPLAVLFEQGQSVSRAILERGRELGVVRDDVPVELLVEWVGAIDGTGDRWLLANWERLDDEALQRHADLVVDGFRRLLTPAQPGGKS
ncbi:TetR/AcrR family transcriptional regulator [Archangium violaceum]|uniref:TetR/AcrR family transcriptional regulator n=1 Tax=Archangium violaceum TaxID=83451 RepID=UPI00194ED20B|nr:TetR/AcrR family transcriptional regulator [Archangium violaceum]QRN96472.1 TetR/AcrR family transcriptional regulator [Archangium violaceum]